MISMAADYPDRVAGVVYGLDTVRAPAAGGRLQRRTLSRGHGEHEHARHDRVRRSSLVTPPSWRPDLTDPADLAEEVIRLEGYENIPVADAAGPPPAAA